MNNANQTKTYNFDASNQPLGRLAVSISLVLLDKNASDFLYHQKKNKRIIVKNTDLIKFTGNKLNQKKYYSYSGFPGGIKEVPLKRQMEKDSTVVLRNAILGMLPKNKLQSRLIAEVKMYKGEIK